MQDYPPMAEHGLIGDLQTAALVSTHPAQIDAAITLDVALDGNVSLHAARPGDIPGPRLGGPEDSICVRGLGARDEVNM